ncbi:MAG: hypothetical protein AAF441_21305 [Pseudomonadota bacterium]
MTDAFTERCQQTIDEAMRQAGMETVGEDPVSVRSEAIRILAERCVGWQLSYERQREKISAGYERRRPAGVTREPG